MGNDETEDRVRRRLRDLRIERGLTLAEAADAAGMAPSTLSRLEQGQRRLALDHLPALARALGTTTDDLLAPPPAQDPRVKLEPHEHDGMTVWPLTRDDGGSGTRAFKIRYTRGTPDLRTHAGHDWTYVLSGRLRLVLGEDGHRRRARRGRRVRLPHAALARRRRRRRRGAGDLRRAGERVHLRTDRI